MLRAQSEPVSGEMLVSRDFRHVFFSLYICRFLEVLFIFIFLPHTLFSEMFHRGTANARLPCGGTMQQVPLAVAKRLSVTCEPVNRSLFISFVLSPPQYVAE